MLEFGPDVCISAAAMSQISAIVSGAHGLTKATLFEESGPEKYLRRTRHRRSKKELLARSGRGNVSSLSVFPIPIAYKADTGRAGCHHDARR